jgi:hypothetical protein
MRICTVAGTALVALVLTLFLTSGTDAGGRWNRHGTCCDLPNGMSCPFPPSYEVIWQPISTAPACWTGYCCQGGVTVQCDDCSQCDPNLVAFVSDPHNVPDCPPRGACGSTSGCEYSGGYRRITLYFCICEPTSASGGTIRLANPQEVADGAVDIKCPLAFVNSTWTHKLHP